MKKNKQLILSTILSIIVSIIIFVVGAINIEKVPELSDTAKTQYDENKSYYESIRKNAEDILIEKHKVELENPKVEPVKAKNIITNKAPVEQVLESVDVMLGKQTYDFTELSQYFKTPIYELDPVEDDLTNTRRFIDQSQQFSFKIKPGDRVEYAGENNGFNVYNITNSQGRKYMTIEVIYGQTACYEMGVCNTGDFLHQASEVIYNNLGSYDFELRKVGNTHLAMVYQNEKGAMGIIHDGFGNVIIISLIDQFENDMYIFDAIMNVELFKSDGYRFIYGKNRDRIYLNKINSVEEFE